MNSTSIEIADASVEILEIMKYAPFDIKIKFLDNYSAFFRKLALNSKHIWKYDISKKLYEQNISNVTKRVLFKLYNKLVKNN